MNAAEFVRQLANDPAAAEALVAFLKPRLDGAKPSHYSSLNLPPDMPSRDRFRRLAPSIAGAYRVAKVWFVPVDEYEKYRVAIRPNRPLSDAEMAKQILKQAGYRPTR